LIAKEAAMKTIVTIHSFRRGVGKSSLSANLAVLLALQGKRVALVDTDFQAPSIHLFFGLSDEAIPHALNNYLWGKCDILSAVQDITPRLASDITGKLFIIPASNKISDIMHTISTPLDIDRYTDGLEKMGNELSLDLILVDTSAGLNEDTLQAIAVSNAVVLVLHPDKRDFQGTAVTVDMIRRLQVPAIHLVLNDVPQALDLEDAHRQLEENYHCGRGVVLKHSEELMSLSSSEPFALRHQAHPLTAQIKELAERLIA
jgi:MinD-like ATPase involved in chromosome partitioning or flagellar assembly